MQSISFFLDRFKKFSRPDIQIRESVSKAIKSEIGADVPEKDISVKEGVVYIKTHNSILKNELFLKKKNILDTIQNVCGIKNIRDIK
ncbi:MAG: hypothetical protein UT05_C0003G0072 [Parcubacteria group bacterium GW2011_GWF2_38_76]|nr:MAG: hypothetical protein UT05_C0003G0072 [Parcubacteria group bacterium GW2011_GWF2_38_76]HBM46156.1 hypothetical protein [Patescibacteria group bacterium]